ncbi:MAG: PKD domain-containing protein [Flavobacteriales bacterium]|nr:PKD domain-containing protein [Flavobacteriales bacterium]
MRSLYALLGLFLAAQAFAQPAICDELNVGFNFNVTPNGVQFTNATTGVGQQTSWQWTFGDGSNSTEPQPIHPYAGPGTYEVCLYAITIYFNGGPAPTTCVDTACSTVVIQGPNPCDGLSSEFWFNNNGGTPSNIFYSAATGAGPNWFWSFGDGTSSDNGPQGTHTYPAPGEYTLCLTVWAFIPGTQEVCSDTTCQTVIVPGSDPCGGFNAAFTWVVTPNGAVFSNGTTGTGNQTTWLWTFGDGATSMDAQPVHVYAQSGTYSVCLKATTIFTGPNGTLITCVDEYCADVVVQGSDPCVELNASFNWTSTPNGVYFVSNSTGLGQSSTFSWTFGDGSTGAGTPVVHVYPGPGTYNACLLVITLYQTPAGGTVACTDQYCAEVVVGGTNPCDALAACFQTTTTGNNVAFQNCTQPNTNIQYVWHFGDGSTGSEVNPDHAYAEPGTYEVCLTAYWNNCVDEFCSTVVIQGGGNPCDQLDAAFNWTSTPNGVYFFGTATGLGQSTTWSWSFGDGTTGSGSQLVHVYPGPGSYNACLTVTTVFEVNGTLITCTDEYCVNVTVGGGNPCEQLDAAFNWTSTPNGVYFSSTATGLGQSTTWSWSFGDGTTGSGSQLVHVYPGPGTYNACLTVVTIFEVSGTLTTCADEYCTNVVIGGGNPCDGLNAGFQGSAADLGVNFANAVINTQWTYSWTFGDGTVGDGPNPYHIYPAGGTYEVCLTVWTWNPSTQDTCFADHCEMITVQSSDPCDGFDACFVPSSAGPLAVFFNNCTPNEPGTQFVWHFGDGITGSGVAPTHNYAEAGTYIVCLNAYWNTCVSEYCTTVVVQGAGNPCDQLDAAFNWTSTPNGVYFFGTATGLGQSTTWSWSFGDGTTGSGSQLVHVYPGPGSYNACLTVTTVFEVNGTLITCTDEYCVNVTVGGGNPCNQLDAAFNWTSTPNGVYFFGTATGLGQSTTWSWSFGDGTTGSGSQLVHVYPGPGSYNACLTVTTVFEVNGTLITCTDEYCVNVTVGGGNPCDQLDAAFNWTSTPNGVYFSSTATGLGQSTTWSWSFGDGTTGSGSQLVHVYPGPGSYNACLTVTTVFEVNGTLITCTDEYCVNVTVGGGNPCDQLDAAFNWTSTPNGVYFSSTATGLGQSTTWSWSFGDGTTGSGSQLVHVYPGPGTYHACLTITTIFEINGNLITCTDEVCNEVVVEGVGGPCDGLNAGFTWNATPNGVQFSNGTTGVGFQTTWHWTFGDGSTSADPQPFHTYSQSGTYQVCLVVTSLFEIPGTGVVTCVDEFCSTVVVNGPGCTPFTVSFTHTGQGPTVVYMGTASVPVTGFLWFFGDGGEGYGEVVTHIYEPPGPFHVCIAAWTWNAATEDTCWAEHCEWVNPFENSVGLEETSAETIRVYPIPARDHLILDGLTTGGDARIWSADGRLVYTERVHPGRNSLAIDQLAPAIYVLELKDGNQRNTFRFTVER